LNRLLIEYGFEEPRNPGLLELRAELAGQWSDAKAQAEDYSAAIKILAEPSAGGASPHLEHLHQRLGDAYVALQKWPEAVAAYAHVITSETTDAVLLSNRARAFEALKNWDAAAADWSRAATENLEGAKLIAEFARRLAACGQVRLAKAQFEKCQALYQRVLEVDPEKGMDKLVKGHASEAAGLGDLFAAIQDWKRAIVEYRRAVADQPADVALLTKLATAYQSAGRTCDAVPYLATLSYADPSDATFSLKVAALQAWFGQEKELAATLERIRAFAKDTTDADTANEAAIACSIRASSDKADLDAALALARKGVELHRAAWRLLALGMAEYRSGKRRGGH
jgi:tetratricopeptide (TPR) repeat protein